MAKSRKRKYGHKCISCGKLRFISPVELCRAARQRCLGCGGTLTECDSAAERIACANDAKSEQREIIRDKMESI